MCPPRAAGDHRRRPQAEMSGGCARSSRPASTLARCRSSSSSVASPSATSCSRTVLTRPALERRASGQCDREVCVGRDVDEPRRRASDAAPCARTRGRRRARRAARGIRCAAVGQRYHRSPTDRARERLQRRIGVLDSSQPPGRSTSIIARSARSRSGRCTSTSRAWTRSKSSSGGGSRPTSCRRTSIVVAGRPPPTADRCPSPARAPAADARRRARGTPTVRRRRPPSNASRRGSRVRRCGGTSRDRTARRAPRSGFLRRGDAVVEEIAVASQVPPPRSRQSFLGRSSSVAISATVRTMRAAATFSSRWSTRDVPGIGSITGLLRSVQASTIGPTRWNRQVVGFDPNATNSTTAAAKAAYAKAPIPQLPGSQFNAAGGLLFATDNNRTSATPRRRPSARAWELAGRRPHSRTIR